MKKILLLIFVLLVFQQQYSQSYINTYSYLPPRQISPNFSVIPENPTSIGEFVINPNITFYIPVSTFARARVLAYKNSTIIDQRILIRAFDSDERIIHWQYQRDYTSSPLFYPKDNYVNNLSPLPLTTNGNYNISNDASFALVGNGVHQVRVTSRQESVKVQLVLSQPLDYGVSFQNGTFSNWTTNPNTMYFYIPNKATQLNLSNISGTITINNQDNNVQYSGSIGSATISIPPTACGTVWSVNLPSTFSFRAWGFPFILCNSILAANTIKASVETGINGEVVCHKFQKRLLTMKSAILNPAIVGVASSFINNNLTPYTSSWLASPIQNNLLINGYKPLFSNGVFSKLVNQNVNPTSHWGGALFSNTLGTWDNYLSTPNVGGNYNDDAYALGSLANINVTINPYFNHKIKLLNRATASEFLDLLKMGESESFPESDQNQYPGGFTAFHYGAKLMPNFGLIAPEMPDSVREIWTEALRHIVDRHLCDYITSTRNQSAHYVSGNEEFYIGSNDTIYKNLSRFYAKLFIASQHPSGYYEEAYGPCGSYNGITNFCLGDYCRLSGDTAMQNSLSKVYEFFNHTVGPEPTKKNVAIGGFNFNHRIGMGCFEEQYDGAKFLTRKIPGIGIRNTKTNAQKTVDSSLAISGINLRLNNNFLNGDAGVFSYRRYKFYEDPDTTYIWPALKHPFYENKANELLAVKKEEYFSSIYIGKPAGSYVNPKIAVIRPTNVNENDTLFSTNIYSCTPILGGGLTTFWNKDYGTSVMSTNWSPGFHNGLMATIAGTPSLRYWETYNGFTATPDQINNKLYVNGVIENQPISYNRTYNFFDGYLDIAVKLTATSSYNLLNLNELIPYVKGNIKEFGVIETKNIDSLFTNRYRSFYQIINNKGYGIKILFDSLKTTQRVFGMRSLYGDYRIDHLELELANAGSVGSIMNYGYHIIPINRLTKGMIGQWRWKGDARDNAGYDLHGSTQGLPNYIYNLSCSHIELNGTNQFITTPKFNNPNKQMSFSIWLKSNTLNWNDSANIVTKNNCFSFYPNPTVSSSGKEIEFWLWMNSNVEKISFDLQLIQNFNITDWHMYSVTYNSINGEFNFYVDTILTVTKNVSLLDRNINVNFNELFIGKSPNGSHYFNGKIGELRLYNEAIDDSIIKEIYIKQNCSNILNYLSDKHLQENDKIILSPNPTIDKVFISSTLNISKVYLYSSDGKLLITKNTYSDKKALELNINQLINGIYIVEIITESSFKYTKKLIVCR